MGKIKYTDEHFSFIRENVVNSEKKLQELFNQHFCMNISLSGISNLKHKAGAKSGLVGGRFQKGQVSHNKGKRWDEFMSLEGQMNSSKTTFKKGHIPFNHRTVGSERISRDGYVEVKIKEPNIWKLKHRLLWEEKKGAIPKGYKIIFLDGDKLNISLENLEMVSSSEELTMNRSKLFFAEPEFTKTGIMISKLKNSYSKKRGNTHDKTRLCK